MADERQPLTKKAKAELDKIVEKHGFVAVVEYLGEKSVKLPGIAGREFAEAIDLGNYSYGEPLDDTDEEE